MDRDHRAPWSGRREEIEELVWLLAVEAALDVQIFHNLTPSYDITRRGEVIASALRELASVLRKVAHSLTAEHHEADTCAQHQASATYVPLHLSAGESKEFRNGPKRIGLLVSREAKVN